MSILGQATAAAAGEPGGNWIIPLVAGVLALFAVVVAALAGVFRRGSIAGPSRLGERESLGMLVLVLGMAVLLLIMAQVFCVTAQPMGKNSAATAISATTQATTTRVVTTQVVAPLEAPAGGMTPAQLALASSVPPLIAFAFMVIANRTIRVNGLAELGFTRRRIGRGVLAGLVGSLVAVPLVFVASMVTEFVWQSLHYSHPSEHELLNVLGKSSNPLLGMVLVASAVAIAPLFEELLFRGHLQTLLTYAWVRLGARPRRGFEVIPLDAGFAAPPVAEVPRPEPSVRMRWVAVILTATLFSLVHPLWMRPPIFVLAICLGYAYERTGNLWTTITMHAVFNGVNTVLFMTLMR
jgi:membrane protease YdiL (CAAX protease family)